MQGQHPHIALVFKYLSGDLNTEEEVLFNNLFKHSTDFQILINEYQKIWDLSGQKFPEEIDSVDVEKEWNIFKNHNLIDENKSLTKKRTPYYFLKIAAAILIFVFIGAGTLYTFIPKKQILTTENRINETELPDGSKITMNKNSRITFTSKYNKKDRSVNLMGDAFFDIEKNPEKPFIINAESFFVEVLGTRFYVNSIQDQRKVIVTEGIVAVWQKKDKSDKILLKAGEELLLDLDERPVKQITPETSNHLSWKTKIFTFKDKSLDMVCSELKSVYDIDFIFENENLKACRLSASFDNQSIDEIINVLTATFDNLKFERVDNSIYIKGINCN
jgi:ferric-dicitrate binding protein FerR (iron transport regulator)